MENVTNIRIFRCTFEYVCECGLGTLLHDNASLNNCIYLILIHWESFIANSHGYTGRHFCPVQVFPCTGPIWDSVQEEMLGCVADCLKTGENSVAISFRTLGVTSSNSSPWQTHCDTGSPPPVFIAEWGPLLSRVDRPSGGASTHSATVAQGYFWRRAPGVYRPPYLLRAKAVGNRDSVRRYF